MRIRSFALLLLGLLIPALLARAADPPPAPKDLERFGESISVGLATVRARIVDDSGAPILGLKPAEVRVSIDRRTVPTVAVDYYDGSVAAAALPDDRVLPAQPGAPHVPQGVSARGQLFVFFVEADPGDRDAPLDKTTHLKRLAEALKPDDLAAVVSLDDRFKLQLDLTRDRAALYRALVHARQGSDPVGLFPPGRLTLARFWNEAKAKTTAHTEEALLWLGAYLDRLPGEKVVFFLGQGHGHFSIPPSKARRPAATAELLTAVGGLQRARASLFVLDEPRSPTTPAAVYLHVLAESTGGAYVSIMPSRDEAADRLARLTRGYYLVTFNLEQLQNPAPTASLAVELVGRPGQVLVAPLQVVNLRS